MLAGFVLLGALFWYLVLPRFEQYGRLYAALLTVVIAGGAVFFLVWYALLIGAVVSQRIYLAICLRRGSNLFVMLFPPSPDSPSRSASRATGSAIRSSRSAIGSPSPPRADGTCSRSSPAAFPGT